MHTETALKNHQTHHTEQFSTNFFHLKWLDFWSPPVAGGVRRPHRPRRPLRRLRRSGGTALLRCRRLQGALQPRGPGGHHRALPGSRLHLSAPGAVRGYLRCDMVGTFIVLLPGWGERITPLWQRGRCHWEVPRMVQVAGSLRLETSTNLRMEVGWYPLKGFGWVVPPLDGIRWPDAKLLGPSTFCKASGRLNWSDQMEGRWDISIGRKWNQANHGTSIQCSLRSRAVQVFSK